MLFPAAVAGHEGEPGSAFDEAVGIPKEGQLPAGAVARCWGCVVARRACVVAGIMRRRVRCEGGEFFRPGGGAVCKTCGHATTPGSP